MSSTLIWYCLFLIVHLTFDLFFRVRRLSYISSMRRSVSSPDATLRKYDAQRSIFDELRGASSGDETLCRMLDITSQTE